jgi:hypothetical protein
MIYPTCPPPYGDPLSTLPAPPALPELPSQTELDAILELFDELAERDTQRRLRKYTKTARPAHKDRRA